MGADTADGREFFRLCAGAVAVAPEGVTILKQGTGNDDGV
jgi:hypothetical protein